MAPELFFKHSDNASPGIDVWAMGCILYALVSGKLPFNGDSRRSIRNKIINDPLFFPSDLKISRSLKDLLEKMLHKDPKLRISIGDIYHHFWVINEEKK